MNLSVSYFECDSCGYVQTEYPFWLARAYAEPISTSDTGILVRNDLNARIVIMVLQALGLRGGTVVDCAGGYGILVRMLRDYGIEALWDDKYCVNLLANGFNYEKGVGDLATAFEAFEHFTDPIAELKRQLTIAPNVLISTEIIPEPTPIQQDWWYYGSDHGQHIGFFRIRTLMFIAKKLGKHLVSDGRSYHLFSDNEFSSTLWCAKLFVLRVLSKGVRIISAQSFKSKTWSDNRRLLERATLKCDTSK